MFRRSFSRPNPNFRRAARPQFRSAQRGQRSTPPAAHRYINKAAEEQVSEVYVPAHQFSDFSLPAQLLENIKKRGYTQPTPIQDQAIQHILNGADVVGIANTGTGKTAAFLLPLINKMLLSRNERVLVIIPTRELAVQIAEEFAHFSRGLGLTAALCIGGTSLYQQVVALRRNPNILIGTPGRLKDLIERRNLQLNTFRTVVLDEVDRMVDIGFIHDIRHLVSLLPHERQSLFFSATISPEISNIMQSFLRSPVTVSVKKKETAAGIDQDVIRVASRDEKLTKLHELLKQTEFTKVLVFVRTKWNAEKLAKNLNNQGFRVAAIHGNKSQSQRLKALTQFKQNHLQVMVATDIAARGLDIENVSHVINYDEPDTYDNYVHRIGRTGRADKQGKALTFVL